ncbi:MAG: hypothetical protein A2V98_04520 [Planctomycetes bacterium RBG_16_64_12]|nr:MAG: hypothetical protein A2V98_04520 [Planctomycetes bacterium RBG_16_64_12]
MARENQGLQIALIIFVMLFIILSVTTFLFFRQYQEAAVKAAEAEEKATTADNTARKIQEDFNTLKGYIGEAATQTIDTIGEDFRSDMDNYAANLPEAQRNYREALKDQTNTIRAKDASLTSEQAANEALKQQVAQLEDTKKPLVAQQKQRADQADAQLAKSRSDYNDARASLTDEQSKQQQQHQQRLQEADKTAQGLQAQIDAHVARIDELQGQLEKTNEKIIAIVKPTFEQADGKIRWVNQRNQTVWINLGRVDALQRLTSFSVYPADTNDVTKVGKKASIEVTQVLGDHLAEARIVEDEPANPIMPGDVIHTPVWAPGEQEHFALTDGIDVDGNGKSDLQMVVNIIRMNGGVVDCYVTDEGQRGGNLTNDTRYLVLGDAPDETSTEARRNARRDLLNDAEQRGLMKITLRDLLDKMGWKNQTPVVHFGREANPNDFRPLPPEGGPKTSSGTVSPLFQPREPLRGSRGSAY